MSNVDNRIVNMQFNNAQFEKNISTSLSSIEKLKQGLKFEGVKDSVSKINNSVKGVTLNGLTNAAEQVKLKFSAMEVAAVTALSNIVNSAVNAGKQMIESLTIEPISQGFEEYEMTMDAVQTIMNGSGRSLEEVNEVLDDLNVYADRTIYSFSDMKSSIGKFVNAGVDLYDAADAIKGISNEAALAGASTQQASQAMYNFSQALSSGSVKLIDWRSINIATMDTVEFKNELIKTALQLGTVVEEEDHFISTTTDANGHVSDAFTATTGWNEALSSQWLTTEVLVETLKKYTDETTDLGQRAYASAQDIKTFTQMMGTLKESVGSGWAVTFQTIFGDFEESKALWTEVSNIITKFLDEQTNGRNALLADWKKLGGREALFNALKNTLEGVFKVINSIKQGFHDIFPPVTAKQLSTASARIEEITENFVNNEGLFNNIRSVVRGIFSAVKIGVNIVKGLWSFLSPILKVVSKGLFTILGYLSDVITFVNSLITNSEVVTNIFGFLSSAVSKAIDGIKWLISKIRDFFASITSSKVKDFSDEVEGTVDPVNKASDALEKATDRVQWFKDKWNSLVEWFKNNEVINAVIENVRAAITNVTLAIRQFMNGTKGLESSGEKLNVFQKIGEWLSTAWTKIKEFFSNIGPSLSSFWSWIKETVPKIGSKLVEFKDYIVEFFGADSLIDLIKRFFGLFVEFKFGKFLGGLGSFFSGFGTFSEAFEDFTESVSKSIKKFLKTKDLIKDVGKSILMIAIAIAVIASIDQDNLDKAVEIVSEIFIAVSVFSIIMNKMASGWKENAGLAAILTSFSSAILKISVALRVVTVLARDHSKSDINQAIEIIQGLVLLVGAFTILLTGFSKSTMSSGQLSMISLILKILSNAIIKISIVIAILSLFKQDKIKASAAVIGGIIFLLGALIYMVSKSKNMDVKGLAMIDAFVKVLGSTILKVGIAIGILSLLKPENVLGSAIVISLIAGLFAGLMLLSKIVSSDRILNLGISIAAATTGILLFSVAVKKLSKVEPEKMFLSIGAILFTVVVLSALGAILSALQLDKGIILLASAMLMFGISVAAFGLGVKMFVDAIEKMNNLGTKGIDTVIGFVDALIEKVPSWSSKIIEAIITTLSTLTTKMAEALIRFLISVIELTTQNASTIVSAIGNLIKALIEAVKELSSTINIDEISNVLVFVAFMAGIIVLLSFSVNAAGKSAYKAILLIALILAEIIGAVLAIDKLGSSPENALKILSGIAEAVLGFAGIIAIVTGLAVLMQGFGKGDKKFSLGFGAIMEALGVIAIIITGMVLMVWLIGFLADVLQDQTDIDPIKDLETAKEVMFKVGEGLASFVSGFAKPILEVFKDSEHIMGSMIGIAALLLATALITPLLPLLGLFIIGLGELGLILEEYLGDGHIEKVFESASKIMAGLGKAIGEFVGGLISGVFDALSSGFADSAKKFATGLSDMMTELQPFLNSVSNVDESTVNAALKVAEMLLAFTGVEILQGITGWITGGVNFEKFGKDLVALAPYLVQFCDKLREGNFDAQLVERSANAASILAAFASNLPKEGGWWQKVAGETMDMETFGTKLVAFGESMVKYGETVEGITEPQIKAIEKTSEVSEDIVKIANSLPAQDGFWQLIAGESDIEKFGKKLVSFGDSMVSYASKVSSLDDTDKDNIDRSVKMAEAVVELADKIPQEGGIWELIAGKDDLATFGEKIVLFADSMVSFSETIGRLNIRSANKMDKALDVAERFSTIAENIKNTDGIEALSKGLEGFAESSVEAFKNVFIMKVDEAVGAGSDFIGAVARGMHNNQNNVKQEAKDEIQEIIDSVLSPIKDSNLDIEDAVKKIIESQIEIINSYTGDGYAFYNAGDNAVQGLINGIKSRIQDAKTAGFDLGYAVYEGTKEGLQEKSPSHIMRDDAAFYAVKGLVLGIKDKLSMVWSSGKEMGSTLYEGTKQSILKIANSVNDNMDLRPVISPVLDLSDVESGAGQINGMLNSRVSSNLAGYTSQLIDRNRMSNYELQINQNGSKEVVSAINNLTSRMDSLEEAILNRPINLDGKKVSKIVAPGINKELGIMQSYARRGN